MTKFEKLNSNDAAQWIAQRVSLFRPLVVGTFAQAVQNPGKPVRGFHIATGDGGKVLALLMLEALETTPKKWYVLGFSDIEGETQFVQAGNILSAKMNELRNGAELHTLEHDPLADL